MVPTTHHERRSPVRTCIGCGHADALSALVRLVVGDISQNVAGGASDRRGGLPFLSVAFDLAGGSFGRGAHVHARPACLARAPRGLSRAFRREVRVDAVALGRTLAAACDRRIAGLIMAAARQRAVAIGADASAEALRSGTALGIVAVDAGAVASRREVLAAAAAGRVIGWQQKSELGALLGAAEVSICAVCHESIAAEIKKLRAASDAAADTIREGAECSRRPEAR